MRGAKNAWAGAAITAMLIAALLAPARGGAQTESPAPVVHVTQVEGPVPRSALRSLLARAPFRSCQCTFIGGPLRFVLHVAADGALSADAIRANEEIDVYVPCVLRELARLHAAAQTGETRAHVTIVFPSLGLGAPNTPAPMPP